MKALSSARLEDRIYLMSLTQSSLDANKKSSTDLDASVPAVNGSAMSYEARMQASADTLSREWLAYLNLDFESKVRSSKTFKEDRSQTVLKRSDHRGPLRVQRPFYPHDDTACHMYLLHPPGGLVIGDRLDLHVNAKQGAQVLLTTPSAGKFYGLKALGAKPEAKQEQNIELCIEDASVEWLPQETILFDSAHARLSTKIELFGDNAKCFVWDIVRLGRAASGETFDEGTCHQSLEVWKNDQPYFIEKNKITAQSVMAYSKWGLQGQNTFGTLFTTLVVDREHIDRLVEILDKNYTEASTEHWALTQKNTAFIARYLGHSVTACREGFEYIWRTLRPQFSGQAAVTPRIWHT